MNYKRTKNKNVLFCNISFFIFICIIITSVTSCEKSDVVVDSSEYAKLLQQSNSTSVTTHRWFYFTPDGFKETDIPRNAPEVEPVPWTQAVRITSGALIEGQSYLVVNKLGIMQAPQTFGFQKDGIASEAKLIKNVDFFSGASTADIFYIDEKIIFNFYTNNIFDNTTEDSAGLKAEEPFLVEFNTSNLKFTPLLSMQSLSENIIFQDESNGVPDFLETEIREVFYNEQAWSILLKSNQSNRTDFYAISFTRESSLTERNTQALNATMMTVNEYREMARPKPISELPQTIQNLLKPVPTRVSYYLQYSEENSPSPTQYEHLSHNTRPIEGYALGLEHCSIAVFEDGTICFAGGLPSKGVINNGETRAFKLPDLGPGYVYGSIALSGSTLFVGWEETSFYETGASGFLAVDMEQVLYENTVSGD